MLMNNQIDFKTTGITDQFGKTNTGIHFKNFETKINSRTEKPFSIGEMHIGDIEITIFFSSEEEIVEFCETHNIDYFDERMIDEQKNQKEA